jgi:hypothetical protein
VHNLNRLNRRFLADQPDQPAGGEEDEKHHKKKFRQHRGHSGQAKKAEISGDDSQNEKSKCPTEHIPTPRLHPLKENAAGNRKVPERERDGGSVFPAPANGFGGPDQPGEQDGKKGFFLGHPSKKLKHGFILVVLRAARIGGGTVGMGTSELHDQDPAQGPGEQKTRGGGRCPGCAERRNKSDINRVGPEADANPDNRRAGDQQKAAKSRLRAKALA